MNRYDHPDDLPWTAAPSVTAPARLGAMYLEAAEKAAARAGVEMQAASPPAERAVQSEEAAAAERARVAADAAAARAARAAAAAAVAKEVEAERQRVARAVAAWAALSAAEREAITAKMTQMYENLGNSKEIEQREAEQREAELSSQSLPTHPAAVAKTSRKKTLIRLGGTRKNKKRTKKHKKRAKKTRRHRSKRYKH